MYYFFPPASISLDAELSNLYNWHSYYLSNIDKQLCSQNISLSEAVSAHHAYLANEPAANQQRKQQLVRLMDQEPNSFPLTQQALHVLKEWVKYFSKLEEKLKQQMLAPPVPLPSVSIVQHQPPLIDFKPIANQPIPNRSSRDGESLQQQWEFLQIEINQSITHHKNSLIEKIYGHYIETFELAVGRFRRLVQESNSTLNHIDTLKNLVDNFNQQFNRIFANSLETRQQIELVIGDLLSFVTDLEKNKMPRMVGTNHMVVRNRHH